MRKTIATIAALAFATAALPAFAASHHVQKEIPSITEIVTAYAVQISTAGSTVITAALTTIASPATFDAAGWAAKIAAANGTPTFVQTVVDAVNAAIAARQAALGPGYVTVSPAFYAAAKAANPATR